MRAVAVSRFRAPAQLMELPKPEPRAGELLVKVRAAGVNPFDAKIADGLFDGQRPHVFPLILGVDGAGTVADVGPGVTRFRVGDRVTGQFLHDPIGTGTYAEFAPVPEQLGVARIPDGMRFDQAAALPTAGMTALDSLDSLSLSEGHALLIVGASGGVGSFATEIAASMGIRVTALARRGSSERLRALGAGRVIDPADPEAVSVLRTEQPSGFDGMLDLMSDRVGFTRWLALVRRGGSAATTTYSADPEAGANAGVRAVNIDLQPTASLLGRLLRIVSDHRLGVPLERSVALPEAPAALAELKAGRGRGKVVVEIPS